jgi:hypothetical protein
MSTTTLTTADDLAERVSARLLAAADLILARGWDPDGSEDEDGPLNVMEAIQYAGPADGSPWLAWHWFEAAQDNDPHLLDVRTREADGDSSAEEIAEAYRLAACIAPAALVEFLGPQWRELVAMGDVAAGLSDEVAYRLGSLATGNWSGEREDDHPGAVAVADAIYNERYDADVVIAYGGAWAAKDAATCLARRHEVSSGEPGALTIEEYRTWSAAWVEAVGPLHPADVQAGLAAPPHPARWVRKLLKSRREVAAQLAEMGEPE